MNLQYIRDVIPQATDKQILGVATAIATQPDRVLLARMLGLDGVPSTLNQGATGLRLRGEDIPKKKIGRPRKHAE